MAFLLEADVIREHEKALFNIFEEIREAKKYLQHHSISLGCSVYDHLADLIKKILICKPEDIVETFEIFSKQVKDERFISNSDTLQDEYISSDCLENINKLLKLYQQQDYTLQNSEDSEVVVTESNKAEVPNITETNFYFKQAGFGLPEEEAFHVMVALRKLVDEYPIENVRFFGKIFGTKQNYYIAETDVNTKEKEKRLKEFLESHKSNDDLAFKKLDERDKEIEKRNDLHRENTKFAEDDNSLGSDKFPVLPPIPRSSWIPPDSIPQEKPGEGCNTKVYWVCNKPGDNWVCLPDVTPDHIDVSRKITTYMTGNLDTPMTTFPPFNGKECEYLRAQIARLVAGTSVSPITYYIQGIEGDDKNEDDKDDADDDNDNDDEEQEDIEIDEDGSITDIKKNKNYTGHTIENLADKSLSFWVHHSQHILNQGRGTYWKPNDTEEEIGEADDDIELDDEISEKSSKSEWGPPLLTSLTEDKFIGGVPAWTVSACCKSVASATLVFLYSRRWPGAAAYATKDGKYDYMYIGWGVKNKSEGFSPIPLPPICGEYPQGPEIMEIDDPTPSDEEIYRTAHLRPEISPPLINAEDPQDLSGEDSKSENEDEDENENEYDGDI